jgi:hypothetical protein
MTHEVPQPMLDPPRAAPRGIGGARRLADHQVR